MGSNHMNEHFRSGGKNRDGKPKYEIPTHDPQTGEANPYYEELTGKDIPKEKLEVKPEMDNDKLDRLLLELHGSRAGYRRKILMLKKFVDIAWEHLQHKKED